MWIRKVYFGPRIMLIFLSGATKNINSLLRSGKLIEISESTEIVAQNHPWQCKFSNKTRRDNLIYRIPYRHHTFVTISWWKNCHLRAITSQIVVTTRNSCDGNNHRRSNSIAKTRKSYRRGSNQFCTLSAFWWQMQIYRRWNCNNHENLVPGKKTSENQLRVESFVRHHTPR